MPEFNYYNPDVYWVMLRDVVISQSACVLMYTVVYYSTSHDSYMYIRCLCVVACLSIVEDNCFQCEWI